MQEGGALLQEGLHQPVGGDHGPQRRVARGEPLGHRDDVGLVPVAVGAEPVPETAERADHLVGDQEDAVPVADLAHPLEVPVRRWEAPASVLHRLEVDRGDGVRPLPDDGPLDLVGGPPSEGHLVVGEEGRPVEVGVGDLDRAGDQRLEGGLEVRYAGDRQRPHGGPVVGDLAADDLGALRLAGHPEVLAGQLPGRFDRLGAAGGEEDAVEVARGIVGQSLGQLYGAWVGVGPEGEVGQCARLLRSRLGQLGAPVADL